MSSPEVEAAGGTANPSGPPATPAVRLDAQASTQNPSGADAIVTTNDPPAAETIMTADSPADTHNPGAAVTSVSTGDCAAAEPAPDSPAASSTADPAGDPGLNGDGAQADTQRVVLVLERQLLPAGLPIFPQVRLAGLHLVAAGAPGGGCLDAFALAGGTIALMVARAPGHGPRAVAALAELRNLYRQALHDGFGLADALSRLDEFAGTWPADRGTAACLALLDPVTGSVRYASAGHTVPLVYTPPDAASGGSVSLLPATGDKPLGFGAGQPAVATANLAPGSVLLLGGDGRDGTEPFAAAAGATLAAQTNPDQTSPGQTSPGQTSPGPASPDQAGLDRAGADGAAPAEPEPLDEADRLCAAVAARLKPGTGDEPADGDVTVLAAHRLAEPAPGLSLRLPAEATALRQLRARLAEWLAGVGASTLDRVDTELAVYEAAANAIVHGRPTEGPGLVSVDVDLDGVGGVLIQVADQGRWQPRTPARDGERPGGRGLAVISKVTDELTITPSASGTTVIMRRGLAHPVTVDRAPAR